MVKTFRLWVFVLILCCSPYAFGAEDTTEHKPRGFNPAECFDKIWDTINEEFWDPNFNGVDWEDARKRYRPKAIAAEDHEAFAEIVNQMLAALKTSHTRYFTKWDTGYYVIKVVFGNPETHRSGIGVVTKKIEGRYYVIAVIRKSPAQKAGILAGDWLAEADGQPFHPIRSFENKAGQKVDLIVQRGPSARTRSTLTLEPIDMKEKDRLGDDSFARL